MYVPPFLSQVAWTTITPSIQLFASHSHFVRLALERLQSSFKRTLHKKALESDYLGGPKRFFVPLANVHWEVRRYVFFIYLLTP